MEETVAEFNYFKDKAKLFVAIYNEQPIVTLWCYYSQNTCYLWGVGSETKGTDDVNKFCYKTAIEYACNNDYRFVDFGQSEEVWHVSKNGSQQPACPLFYMKNIILPKEWYLKKQRNWLMPSGRILFTF